MFFASACCRAVAVNQRVKRSMHTKMYCNRLTRLEVQSNQRGPPTFFHESVGSAAKHCLCCSGNEGKLLTMRHSPGETSTMCKFQQLPGVWLHPRNDGGCAFDQKWIGENCTKQVDDVYHHETCCTKVQHLATRLGRFVRHENVWL